MIILLAFNSYQNTQTEPDPVSKADSSYVTTTCDINTNIDEHLINNNVNDISETGINDIYNFPLEPFFKDLEKKENYTIESQ